MRFKGFIGPSYTLQSVNVDCQRCINMYPEINELGTGKEGEVASLVGTPGLQLLLTLPTGPIRGQYTDSSGHLWAVGGNILYQISSEWTETSMGTLNTSFGPVSFSDNGLYVVVVDGAYGYTYTMSDAAAPATGNITAISNPQNLDTIDFDGTTVTFVSGSPTGNQVQVGGTAALTMTALLTFVNASSDANIGNCTYALDITNTILTLTAVRAGTGGNSITIATSSTALTLSGSTLTGGGAIGFSQITSSNFLGANQTTFMDGYLIFNQPDSRNFYLSGINQVTFNALDVGAAEAAPDNLVGLIALQESLYLFSEKHLEVWYDSGNNNFPFSRIQGSVVEIGCAAQSSIAKIANTVYWLGQDINGQGVVYGIQGLVPQRVSTHAIENVISALGDLSLARAWTYEFSGHAFYCINIPGLTSTWVFDVNTSMWHERAYLAAGQYQRNLVDTSAFAYNTNVAGDYSNGNIYSMAAGVFTDNGNPIVRERTAPHMAKDMDRIFHSLFQLDMETGVGMDGIGQGTAPRAILQWSNDGGHSWSNEHWSAIGAIGARKARVIWRRLGLARDRVYRVRIVDPVKVTMIGAELDVEGGTD